MELNLTTFLQMAQVAAASSPDPSTKVGAVVVRDGVVVADGFNDFPQGIPSSWWQDRPLKYRAVVHAEARAVLNAGRMAQGATVYVTHHPCPDCVKLMAAAGVEAVVCPQGPWRDDPAIKELCDQAAEMMELIGMEVRHA